MGTNRIAHRREILFDFLYGAPCSFFGGVGADSFVRLCLETYTVQIDIEKLRHVRADLRGLGTDFVGKQNERRKLFLPGLRKLSRKRDCMASLSLGISRPRSPVSPTR